MMAQTPLNQRRLIVTAQNGQQKVYDLSRLSEITFDSVADTHVDLQTKEEKGFSVKMTVNKPEECSMYQVTIVPANSNIDWLSYIPQHAFCTETTSKDIELGGLTENTSYIVAALSYDRYGIACGVSTANVKTTKADVSEKPAVGNILYSDGSWSKRLTSGKTPIGIIFSTTTSQSDQQRGYHHGYALALRNAAQKIKWATAPDDLQTGEYTSTEVLGFQTDKEGLSHSLTLLSQSQGLYPAAEAAAQYECPAPAASSGWYLPSSGQWYDICVNLGGLSSQMPRQGNSEGYWNDTQDCTRCLNRINEYMSLTGTGNYEPIQVATGDYQWFWCSSESSKEQAYAMFFDKDQLVVEIAGYFKTYDFSSNRVRAVIAF